MKSIIKVLVWLLFSIMLLTVAYYHYQDLENSELTPEVRQTSSGSFIETPNGFVHYELSGPKSADLVVLVHGFSVPSYLWEPTYQFLLDEGYRVLRFDLFGRGLSDRPDSDYGLNLLSEQINDLLSALKISRPIQLLGLSMGGPVVARFTHQYPQKVNALILQDPLVNKVDENSIFPLGIPLIGEFVFAVYVIPTYVSGHKNDPSKGHHFAQCNV